MPSELCSSCPAQALPARDLLATDICVSCVRVSCKPNTYTLFDPDAVDTRIFVICSYLFFSLVVSAYRIDCTTEQRLQNHLASARSSQLTCVLVVICVDYHSPCLCPTSVLFCVNEMVTFGPLPKSRHYLLVICSRLIFVLLVSVHCHIDTR